MQPDKMALNKHMLSSECTEESRTVIIMEYYIQTVVLSEQEKEIFLFEA